MLVMILTALLMISLLFNLIGIFMWSVFCSELEKHWRAVAQKVTGTKEL